MEVVAHGAGNMVELSVTGGESRRRIYSAGSPSYHVSQNEQVSKQCTHVAYHKLLILGQRA